MSSQPVFYKPVFGNDNFTDVVDIAAFIAPVTKRADAAVQPAKKLSEKI